MLKENDKLGFIVKDQIKIAMIGIETYQKMATQIAELEQELEERRMIEEERHRLETPLDNYNWQGI